MAKNNTLEKYPEEVLEEDFDFFDDLESGNEDVAAMMSSLMESSNQQLMAAIELTKLAVAKSSTESINEEAVFATYKRATKVIAENFPLKDLLEKFCAE